MVPRYLELMRLKQRLHDGDRSDLRIVMLDSLKGSLSYPGWRSDAARAEMWRGFMGSGPGDLSTLWQIEEAVATMRRKQEIHVAQPPSLVSAACRSGASRVVRVLDATGERFGTRFTLPTWMLLWMVTFGSSYRLLARLLA